MATKTGWNILPKWLHTNKFFHKDLSQKDAPMEEVNPDNANLVSSYVAEIDGVEYHYPILDIDFNASLLGSSSPGHYHLMIDKLLTKDEYDKLLRVMVEVGIVQKGILELQWEQDGVTCIRLPNVKKQPGEMSSGGKIIASDFNMTLTPQQENHAIYLEKKDAENSYKEMKKNIENALLTKNEVMTSININSPEKHAMTKKEIEAINPELDLHAKMFENLATIASKTGLPLVEVVGAWKYYLNPPAPEEKMKTDQVKWGKVHSQPIQMNFSDVAGKTEKLDLQKYGWVLSGGSGKFTLKDINPA